MDELHNQSVAELAALLKSKKVSAVEVATRFLARLGGNPHNAFLDINSEVTLAQTLEEIRLCAVRKEAHQKSIDEVFPR